MKKIILFLSLIIISSEYCLGQRRFNKKININKEIKKTTKSLKKEGWVVYKGYSDIESILYSSYIIESEVDSSNNLKYIVEMGVETSFSEILSVQAARANALRNIACTISAEVTTTTQGSSEITNCYEGAIDYKEIGVLVRSINEGKIEARVLLYAENPN